MQNHLLARLSSGITVVTVVAYISVPSPGTLDQARVVRTYRVTARCISFSWALIVVTLAVDDDDHVSTHAPLIRKHYKGNMQRTGVDLVCL